MKTRDHEITLGFAGKNSFYHFIRKEHGTGEVHQENVIIFEEILTPHNILKTDHWITNFDNKNLVRTPVTYLHVLWLLSRTFKRTFAPVTYFSTRILAPVTYFLKKPWKLRVLGKDPSFHRANQVFSEGIGFVSVI